jgi:hypothetical protein
MLVALVTSRPQQGGDMARGGSLFSALRRPCPFRINTMTAAGEEASDFLSCGVFATADAATETVFPARHFPASEGARSAA